MRPDTLIRRFGGGLCVLGMLSLAGTALATEPDPMLPGDRSESAATLPAMTEPAPQRIDGFGAAVDPAGLAELRGGDDVENDIRVNGAVSDNHAVNVTSGTNTLAGGAFANANGINTAIQNSGSNVLIQNAMIVNVQFSDPGL